MCVCVCVCVCVQAKHLQFVSGVNPVIYWLGNYAWDLINALFIVLVSFFIFAAFQVDGYMDSYLGALFWILVCAISYTISLCVCFPWIWSKSL